MAANRYQEGPCFPDSGLTIGSAARGGGIALGRTALVYDHLVQGTLVLASRRIMPSPTAYYAICKLGRENDPAIRMFCDWVRIEAETLMHEVRERFPSMAFSTEE
ncbi:hypothetical protein ASC97_19750 [Rhizobium sp. Root1203]|nr:hypothetical protein ASC97_19750 [Rhizobium sp. Root1203]